MSSLLDAQAAIENYKVAQSANVTTTNPDFLGYSGGGGLMQSYDPEGWGTKPMAVRSMGKAAEENRMIPALGQGTMPSYQQPSALDTGMGYVGMATRAAPLVAKGAEYFGYGTMENAQTGAEGTGAAGALQTVGQVGQGALAAYSAYELASGKKKMTPETTFGLAQGVNALLPSLGYSSIPIVNYAAWGKAVNDLGRGLQGQGQRMGGTGGAVVSGVGRGLAGGPADVVTTDTRTQGRIGALMADPTHAANLGMANVWKGNIKEGTKQFFTQPIKDVTGIGTLVCTELHRQGRISPGVLAADGKFGKLILTREEYEWYLGWARPLVRYMQKSHLIASLVSFFMKPVSLHMAGQMGHGKGSFFGRIILNTLRKVCKMRRKYGLYKSAIVSAIF